MNALQTLVAGLVLVALLPGQHTSADRKDWQEKTGAAAKLMTSGKPAEATEAAREALSMATELFGKDDPDYVTSLLTLSSLLIQQGEWHEAESLAKQAHQISDALLAKAQSRVATTLKFLGNVSLQQGNLDEAEEAFRKAIEPSEAALGADHPETAKHLGNLAAVYLKRGDMEKGRDLLERALTIWEGRPHPVYTVTALTNLAAVHLDQGNEDEALRLYDEGLAIQEQAFGEDSPRLGNLLRKYAGILRQTGFPDLAEEIEKRRKRVQGKQSSRGENGR